MSLSSSPQRPGPLGPITNNDHRHHGLLNNNATNWALKKKRQARSRRVQKHQRRGVVQATARSGDAMSLNGDTYNRKSTTTTNNNRGESSSAKTRPTTTTMVIVEPADDLEVFTHHASAHGEVPVAQQSTGASGSAANAVCACAPRVVHARPSAAPSTTSSQQSFAPSRHRRLTVMASPAVRQDTDLQRLEKVVDFLVSKCTRLQTRIVGLEQEVRALTCMHSFPQ